VNILRRLRLSRLLLLCALAVALGVSATAIASALDSGPTPPAKPLAEAIHDALASPPVEGVSARVQFTNRLIEGAGLASGDGQAGLSSSPLLSGGSGRLWIAKDGRVRLELQAEKGDTQIVYDGHTLTYYDASTNTLYRLRAPAHEGASAPPEGGHDEVPSVAKIEEGISQVQAHANVSGATPTDIAGQPAYTVRVSPKETGSLIGGAELSWDAVHGVPLRAAVYSATSSSPVLELAASEISYGPVDPSVFELTTPSGAKVEEATISESGSRASSGHPGADRHSGARHPTLTKHGHGITTIAVLQAQAGKGETAHGAAALPESLPKVKIGASTANELKTELGTLLSFERAGVRYLVVGAVSPAAVEAVARGL
jgi:outer membrane lipoprotein-sorting protein